MSTVTIDSDGNGTPETQLKYEYDDSGIRVAQEKRVDTDADGDFSDETAERTEYLVDPHNPTGYAQVLEEWVDGVLKTTYTLGLDVISQYAPTVYGDGPLYFLHDGHGSTRGLVDALGIPISAAQDASAQPIIWLAYDAYGNALNFNAATALTTLLYSGEQLDKLTGLQYLRARYYDLSTGRFTRLDPFAGNFKDPQSLHKFLYTHGDPVNGMDPTGEWSLGSAMMTGAIIGGLTGLVGGACISVYTGAKFFSWEFRGHNTGIDKLSSSKFWGKGGWGRTK